MAAAGNYEGALERIREYWGAMLDLGATTFWEDFDMAWLPAGRIDEPVPAGMRDLHRECGAYCYKGFRHSLCHGWASGPTAWLTEYVLGCRGRGARLPPPAYRPPFGRPGMGRRNFPGHLTAW